MSDSHNDASDKDRSDTGDYALASNSGDDLRRLESKVAELVDLSGALARENQLLRTQQQSWVSERAQLIEKNELAKGKVEAMISRLKALEQDA